MSELALPLSRCAVAQDDIAAVNRALSGPVISRGPLTEEFEKGLASYCGAQFSVVFNSGASALRAACRAAGVNALDRLLMSPNICLPAAISAAELGALPVFIDVDPKTGNMELERLAPNVQQETSRGRSLIIPRHYAGVPIAMKELEKLIYQPDAVVIEDALEALGSVYDGESRVGSCVWSQMTVFSFKDSHILTTGEGGAVTTNDPELYSKLQTYRRRELFLTDFQAALGLSQLARIDSLIAKRQQIANWYQEHLQGIPHLNVLPSLTDTRVAPHRYVVRIDFAACGVTREIVRDELQQRGIETQAHYLPVYHQPPFQKSCGELAAYFPGAEAFYAQALSLPLYHDLTEAQVERVSQSLKESLSRT